MAQVKKHGVEISAHCQYKAKTKITRGKRAGVFVCVFLWEKEDLGSKGGTTHLVVL